MTEKISETFEFKYKDKDVTIVMLSGVRNKLSKICNSNGSTLDDLLSDVELQEKFLECLLADYNEKGEIVGKKADIFDLPLDVTEDLLVWGFEHCVNFLTNSALRMKRVAEDIAEKMTGSKPTMNG